MPDPPVCPHCGSQPRLNARFCGACGNPLKQSIPQVTPPGGPVRSQPSAVRMARLRLPLLIGLALIISMSVWSVLDRPRSTVTSAPLLATATPTHAPIIRPTLVQPTAHPTPGNIPPTSTASAYTPNGRLRVHFIDVGQGDSILIQTPDGANALIDGGYPNGRALAYLQAEGITRIDVLIASHPHADHIGGLVEVLHTLPVGAVWTSGATHTTGVFEQFLDAIDQARVPYHEAQTGTTIAVGQMQLAVLRSDPHAADLNDSSLVLRLQHGTISFLFTGDAERPSETALLRTSKAQLTATVLKVGHHGSYTSSSPEFLAAVKPEVAVYSAGSGNSYGHPHSETIQALQAVHAHIYGTPEHGTIVVESDGQRYEVQTSRSIDPAATIPPEAREPDRDCGSFATHAEAQAFFVAAGGPTRDPHGLDGDDDGIACESLP